MPPRPSRPGSIEMAYMGVLAADIPFAERFPEQRNGYGN
jgi:hypothetical protein